MRLCANLSLLFADRPLPDRIVAAAIAGFAGVEAQLPYDDPAPVLRDALARAGVPMVSLNAPPPNWAGGPRGFAAIPGGEARFRTDLRRAVRVAEALGAPMVHLMAGEAEGAAARAAFLANLAHAAAAHPGLTFLLEPLNPHDRPGYFLSDLGQALDVVAEVGAPNLRLLFDAYHVQRLGLGLLPAWDRARAQVAHVQIAQAPGRHEPEAAVWAPFRDRLRADGYGGWVSAEYHPRGRTEDGLRWMRGWAG